MNTSRNLKKIYLDRVNAMPSVSDQSMDRHIRIMRTRLWEEFDDVWLRYEKGKASFELWEKSLDRWLKAELL